MKRDAPADFSLQSGLEEIPAGQNMVAACAHCKKIRTQSGDWIEPVNLPGQSPPVQVTHTICPHCAKILYPHYNLYKS